MKGRQPLMLAAEVALGLLTLSAVLGMNRLFEEGGWFAPLALNAVVAHVTVAGLRQRGFTLPSAAATTAAAAVLVTTWTFYWSTTTAGLPTGSTWSAMGSDLGDAWGLYQEVAAPAPVQTGFLLASAVALWFVAFVADWAAFRLWVPFEATLPAGTLFLFTALLGSEEGERGAVAVFAAALLAYLLVHRLAGQEGSSHWVAERRAAGHRSLLSAGVGLGAIAVVAGAVLGPALPGADSTGVLDPKALRDDDNQRVTISPLVDIQARLVNQANVEVFRVRSPQRSYWRLTSLERFDGRRWTSSGRFGKAGGTLPEGVPSELASETFQQEYRIGALAAIWLPAAYEPRALAIDDVEIRYDEESATLIVANDVPDSNGLTYRLESSSPRITAEDLTGLGGDIPGDIARDHLALPSDFSADVRQLAEQLTADAASPAEAARALQDHLRTFTYDLNVAAGHSTNALETFLFRTQTGYCEQFAGAFAAMARAVGIPTRVAVGFTTGEVSPDEPNVYVVRGEHAHAWPEVYISGAGWVAYEPTPGRGMPFAEPYTGVPEAQAATADPGTATTAPPTTVGPGGATIPTTPTLPVNPDERFDTGDAPPLPNGPSESTPTRYVTRPLRLVLPWVAAAGGAHLVLFPLLRWARRVQRRRRAVTARQRVELAWTESVEEAAAVGFAEDLSDTYPERAVRLGQALPPAALAAGALARRIESATYSKDGADDGDADDAVAAAEAVVAAARAATPRPTRVARWFDPRPVLRSWRNERRLRQRRITAAARGDLEVERELVGVNRRG